MSSENPTKESNIVFISRLKELFGTDEPAVIQRKLGVNYQSAKNYLHGRKPNAEVLEKIVEVTDVSLNWLLMGQGPKYVGATGFDIGYAIDRNEDWRDALTEWFEFEGRTMPDTTGASFMGGWQSFDRRQKIDALIDFKRFLDKIKDE